MLGFYDYTVILTYLSLMSSAFGMALTLNGQYKLAIVCLALSGLLDMFDGKVARSKANRTEDEKMFGIQIDSLVDSICFGVFPALLCYTISMHGILALAISAFYMLAAVIRLGYFNVLAITKKNEEGGHAIYHGLPVTSISITLPLVFLLRFVLKIEIFRWILLATLLVSGIAFITDFKFKKPSNKMLVILVSLVALIFLASWISSKVLCWNSCI